MKYLLLSAAFVLGCSGRDAEPSYESFLNPCDLAADDCGDGLKCMSSDLGTFCTKACESADDCEGVGADYTGFGYCSVSHVCVQQCGEYAAEDGSFLYCPSGMNCLNGLCTTI